MDKEKEAQLALLTEEVGRLSEDLANTTSEESRLMEELSKSNESEVKMKILAQLEEVNGKSQKTYRKYIEALKLKMTAEHQ